MQLSTVIAASVTRGASCTCRCLFNSLKLVRWAPSVAFLSIVFPSSAVNRCRSRLQHATSRVARWRRRVSSRRACRCSCCRAPWRHRGLRAAGRCSTERQPCAGGRLASSEWGCQLCALFNRSNRGRSSGRHAREPPWAVDCESQRCRCTAVATGRNGQQHGQPECFGATPGDQRPGPPAHCSSHTGGAFGAVQGRRGTTAPS